MRNPGSRSTRMTMMVTTRKWLGVFFGKLEVFFGKWSMAFLYSRWRFCQLTLWIRKLGEQMWWGWMGELGGWFALCCFHLISLLKCQAANLSPGSPIRYQPLNITHIGLWIGKLGKQLMLGWAGEFASSSSHLLLHLNLHLKFGSCEARIGGKLPCPISIPQHYPFIF